MTIALVPALAQVGGEYLADEVAVLGRGFGQDSGEDGSWVLTEAEDSKEIGPA